MSAESKKKRGESGISKAKSSPWRLNGWPADWQARRVGAHHHGPAPHNNSTMLRGFVGGVLVQRLGLGEVPLTHGMTVRVEQALGKCPVVDAYAAEIGG